MSLVYDANLVMSKIQEAYENEIRSMRRKLEEQKEIASAHDVRHKVAWDAFLKKCRKPTTEEYAAWVASYLVQPGTKADIVLPFELEEVPDYLIVNDDGAKITRLMDDRGLRIIVPIDREVIKEDDIGHNILYGYKDEKAVVFHTMKEPNRPIVQIFKDTMALIGAVAASAKYGVS